MSIDFHFAWQTLIDGWPLFGYGIAMTLTFAIVGTVAGLIIGLLLGAIRSLEIDPLDSSSDGSGCLPLLLIEAHLPLGWFDSRLDYYFHQYRSLYGGNYSFWYSGD